MIATCTECEYVHNVADDDTQCEECGRDLRPATEAETVSYEVHNKRAARQTASEEFHRLRRKLHRRVRALNDVGRFHAIDPVHTLALAVDGAVELERAAGKYREAIAAVAAIEARLEELTT